MKLYSKEYYDSDQDIRDDYKMHAEKDDRLMEGKQNTLKILSDLAVKTENGEFDEKFKTTISDEIREAFKPFENLERPYIDHCDKYGPVVDLHPEGNRLYYYDVEAALYHSKENIKSIQKKAQTEIEELTESLGTYYDLNMKLEQQVLDTENELTEAINCIEDLKCCGNCVEGKYKYKWDKTGRVLNGFCKNCKLHDKTWTGDNWRFKGDQNEV